MGVTVQWRGENEREPASYGKHITFGNLRDKGTAYMSYSDRVGPGIVVLGGSTELCDRLTSEGFTTLAPALPPERDRAERLLDAAVEHLLDNWHPRVGVLAFGDTRSLAESLSQRKKLDEVALLDVETDVDDDLIDDLRYELS